MHSGGAEYEQTPSCKSPKFWAKEPDRNRTTNAGLFAVAGYLARTLSPSLDAGEGFQARGLTDELEPTLPMNRQRQADLGDQLLILRAVAIRHRPAVLT